RKGMGEIVKDILARGDVDLDVAPVLRWYRGEPALHQRLAGRDNLDDGGMASVQIAFDRADQGWRLHRSQEVAKEALPSALEGGSRGRFGLAVHRVGLTGYVRCPCCRIEIDMDVVERACVGGRDASLLGLFLV